ncbi:GNAT family N-acetyltransferase [Leptobacterium flavescens]|uniref:GNAT family N-acetyltransferase n=1 Tax=Leptobacterium flavescens TaxID=472055 RepID=A0A6P0ULA3_9FLAO|nr:GNAT family N-acetyltransferase [Leptobacterium flavescens]NER14141.1 GNAT family N-acetyltransferase [Leptobacterium flavescens]
MIFETERLSVRLLKETDIGSFHELQSDPEVMRYVGGKPMSLDENKKDLRHVINCYTREGNEFRVWGVFTNDGAFVGTCALIKNKYEEYEIGYRFIKRYWGNAYGIEITRGLINYAFHKLNIDILVAYVDRENKGSVRILDSLFNFTDEFWNEEDNCWDRKYCLKNERPPVD